MDEAREGFVFDIQRYNLHDGRGSGPRLFLQGCHLRCLWCHRSRLLDRAGRAGRFPHALLRGGALRRVPEGLSDRGPVSAETQPVQAHPGNHPPGGPRPDALHPVRGCARVCANKALYFTARTMTVADVLEVIAKDDRYYRKTGGGGVTISGGEPMLQSAFAGAIFRQCKALGCIPPSTTTGNVAWEHYESSPRRGGPRAVRPQAHGPRGLAAPNRRGATASSSKTWPRWPRGAPPSRSACP
jgi:pyruvate formate lyase activating enzyme